MSQPRLTTQCERCKQTADCKFYGRPSDVEAGKAQNGEWLCEPCVPLRIEEIDRATAEWERYLKGD